LFFFRGFATRKDVVLSFGSAAVATEDIDIAATAAAAKHGVSNAELPIVVISKVPKEGSIIGIVSGRIGSGGHKPA
jgi:hypothetical protein